MDNDTIYTIDLQDNLSPRLSAANDMAKQLEQTLQLVNNTANTLGYSFARAFDTQKITDFISAANTAYGNIIQANAQMAGAVGTQLAQVPKETKESFMSSWKDVMEFGNTLFDFGKNAKELLDKGAKITSAFSKLAEAKRLAATASTELTAAQEVEVAVTDEVTAAQTALDVAMDAFPGMLIVTALSALVGWAISASSSVEEVKDNYEELHSIVKETDDIELKATDERSKRLATLHAELEIVKHEKDIADDLKNSDGVRNEALKIAQEHWQTIKTLGGDFTSNLDDSIIDIEKATRDMSDFGDAVQASAMKLAAINSVEKNDTDLADKQLSYTQNARKAVQIRYDPKLSVSDKISKIRDLFSDDPDIMNNILATKKHYGPDDVQVDETLFSVNFQTVLNSAIEKKNAELAKQNSDTNSQLIDIFSANEQKLEPLTQTQQKQVEQKDSYTPQLNNNTDTLASPSKNISIKIDIKELVHEFKIHTTNLYEATTKVKDLVAQALISAVNDSEIGDY